MHSTDEIKIKKGKLFYEVSLFNRLFGEIKRVMRQFGHEDCAR
jgi:hypothetical protein